MRLCNCLFLLSLVSFEVHAANSKIPVDADNETLVQIFFKHLKEGRMAGLESSVPGILLQRSAIHFANHPNAIKDAIISGGDRELLTKMFERGAKPPQEIEAPDIIAALAISGDWEGIEFLAENGMLIPPPSSVGTKNPLYHFLSKSGFDPEFKKEERARLIESYGYQWDHEIALSALEVSIVAWASPVYWDTWYWVRSNMDQFDPLYVFDNGKTLLEEFLGFQIPGPTFELAIDIVRSFEPAIRELASACKFPFQEISNSMREVIEVARLRFPDCEIAEGKAPLQKAFDQFSIYDRSHYRERGQLRFALSYMDLDTLNSDGTHPLESILSQPIPISLEFGGSTIPGPCTVGSSGVIHLFALDGRSTADLTGYASDRWGDRDYDHLEKRHVRLRFALDRWKGPSNREVLIRVLALLDERIAESERESQNDSPKLSQMKFVDGSSSLAVDVVVLPSLYQEEHHRLKQSLLRLREKFQRQIDLDEGQAFLQEIGINVGGLKSDEIEDLVKAFKDE